MERGSGVSGKLIMGKINGGKLEGKGSFRIEIMPLVGGLLVEIRKREKIKNAKKNHSEWRGGWVKGEGGTEGTTGRLETIKKPKTGT